MVPRLGDWMPGKRCQRWETGSQSNWVGTEGKNYEFILPRMQFILLFVHSLNKYLLFPMCQALLGAGVE